MDVATVRIWVRIFRDVVITTVAGFMLVYETVYTVRPNALIVGAGLTLLGLPVAFRLDQIFRVGPNEQINGDEDDPYEGPGGYYRGGR